jgi:hypothetical protein
LKLLVIFDEIHKYFDEIHKYKDWKDYFIVLSRVDFFVDSIKSSV